MLYNKANLTEGDFYLTKRIEFANVDEWRAVLGDREEFLQMIEAKFDCKIISRGNVVELNGNDDEVTRAEKVIVELQKFYSNGNFPTMKDVAAAIKLVKSDSEKILQKIFGETIIVTSKGTHIHAKSLGQQNYIDAMKSHVITFGIGPAGTGKTFLAVAMAAYYLRIREVKKIILTRPAVEAGERLGFLPGDMQEKVDPYLRPLYDALQEIFGFDMYQKFFTRGVIEIAPLAYMRGRTLSDAFIILDEAQNTTSPQMKMFLTRLGFGSRMAVTGDLTQIDLPRGTKSGLAEAVEILKNINGIGICELDSSDVVRHEVVSAIINAYEKGIRF
ncbi:MAG: PhoH family protein [Selenomonadaceae bacterium]|nr:PhoH family protein [Selenomonadaceae bacterium]